MIGAILQPARPWRSPAFGVALAAFVFGASVLCSVSETAAQGYLCGFVAWSGIPLGSLVLLLVHRLVGGRWGEALGPSLTSLAGATPMLVALFIPIAVALDRLYPWTDPGTVARGVSAYLNKPFFMVRSVVALGGWSALALLLTRGRATKLVAGLGLAFYGLMISLVAVDWMLSLDPGFTSTAFGAGIAVQQILSSLAWLALAAPRLPEVSVRRDLAGLLLAALLGVVYIAFMSYLVAWYGNLPSKAAWYQLRGTGGWSWTIGAAFAFGAAVPTALLLSARVRSSRLALRIVGGLVLAGVWLHIAWLIAPSRQIGWLAMDIGATAAAAFLSVRLTAGRMPLQEQAHEG